MTAVRALTVVVCFVLALSSAHGRLNESEKQCDLRFGLPASTDIDPLLGTQKSAIYKRNGFVIRITFLFGKAASIRYEKEDHTPLTEEQINLLLSFNAANVTWKKTLSEKDGILGWDREDSKADAMAPPDRKFLLLTSADLKLFLKAKAAGLDGF